MRRPDNIGIICVILALVISGTSIQQSFAQTPPIAVAMENSTTPPDSSFNIPEKTGVAVLSTKFGDIVIAFNDVAPKTVANFEKLANSGFYDGTIFHRIVPGFVIQGGDPNTKNGSRDTWGTGNAGYSIPPEFSNLKFTKYSVGMARGSDVNSGSSQFFITVGDASFLDEKYTLFGQVVSGQDVVDKIASLSTNSDSQPLDPDTARINKIVIRLQNALEEPLIKQEKATNQQEQITSQQETPQKTIKDNKTTSISRNNTGLTRQYVNPGFGQGQEQDLLVHTGATSGSVTASDDDMSLMNTTAYSLKFPSNWQYNFDGYLLDGSTYDIGFVEIPNNTNSAQIILSSHGGFTFGPNPHVNSLEMMAMDAGLNYFYDYYDKIKATQPEAATVGSTIVASYWYPIVYDCYKSAPNKEHDYGCLGTELHTIRFDRVHDVPAFQLEYSLKIKNMNHTINEYENLNTVYILKDAYAVLSCHAIKDEYGNLEPYFIRSANSLSINPIIHETDTLASRLISDFDAFSLDSNELMQYLTENYTDVKIEHQFPSGSDSASTSVNGLANFLQWLSNWFHL